MQKFFEHPLLKPKKIERRLYQEVLAAKVLDKGNTLIIAPTALGKTIVAILVAVEILRNEKNAKVLFLAPTKPLAEQHMQSFRKFTLIPEEEITLLTGSVMPSKRKELFKDARVICATPQVIENDLIANRISLEDVALLIFDEAHRAVGNYAYVYIAKQYMAKARKPHILAMTASPGSEELKIQDICKNLFVENVELKTPYDSDVRPYLNPIKIEWHIVELPENFKRIKKLLERFMKKKLERLKEFGYVKALNLKYYNRVRLLELQRRIIAKISKTKGQSSLYSAISIVAAILKIYHALLLLETQGLKSMKNYMEKLENEARKIRATKALKIIFSSEEIKEILYILKNTKDKDALHPKQKLLAKLISNEIEKNPEIKIIVFNQYRDSIKEIVDYLNKEVKEAKAKEFVGQASRDKTKGMSQKEQIKRINEFREGKFNVLVAISVAEEGLDIPTVDLVIFYEPIPSEIRSIQRRGRTARAKAGRVIILITKATRDEAYYWAARAKERRMMKAVSKIAKDASKAGKIKIEKQATLTKFLANNESVTIYADTREASSLVTKKLSERADVVLKRLDVADYVISKEIAIERKTTADFLASIIDKRLFLQAKDIVESFEKPLLILEGNFNELFYSRNIHKNAVMGALLSIALEYRIPIIFSKNADETADIIYQIAKHEQLSKGKEIALRIGKKKFTLQEQQQFLVESLPLVGPSLAKKILSHFKTIENLAKATKKELMQVENLGEKKAKLIYDIFHKNYEAE